MKKPRPTPDWLVTTTTAKPGRVELPDGLEAVGIDTDLVVSAGIADVLVDRPVPVQEDGPALHQEPPARLEGFFGP